MKRAPVYTDLPSTLRGHPQPRTIEVGTATGGSLAGWHKVQDFLRCPKEYQFRHVRKIRQPATETPQPFAVGILLHAAKAEWFARKFARDEVTMAKIRGLVQDVAEAQELPVSYDALQRSLAYFEEYAAHWAALPKPTPVACEYTLGPAPLFAGDPEHLWRTGRLDDVSRYPEAGGALCIGDLKTTSGSINDVVNEYTLNGQPLLYTLLWRTASQGERMHGPVKGVILDVVAKGYRGEQSRFARVFISITESSLRWFARDMREVLQAVAAVTPESHVSRNVTACTRMQGRGRFACEYRSLCQWGRSASGEYVTETGGSLLKSKYKIWE